PIVQAIATEIISSALDVTDFGATPTGDTSFVLDEALPPLQLGLATLRYDSLVANDAGMVLGGAVAVGAVANTPFGLTVSRFSGPARIQLCSILSKTGSGDPSREPASLTNTSVFAMAEIDGAGRFCQFDLRSPGSEWLSFVQETPAQGTIAESVTIETKMNYGVALNMPEPMRFVIRTPRGVRYADFGRPPPPIFDKNGKLVVVIDGYIPDCKYIVEGETGGWGIGWHGNKDDFKP